MHTLHYGRLTYGYGNWRRVLKVVSIARLLLNPQGEKLFPVYVLVRRGRVCSLSIVEFIRQFALFIVSFSFLGT